MRCFFCDYPIPAQAGQANFCVDCGRPLTQLCPYEWVGGGDNTDVRRLSLCDASGRPTADCDKCGGMFKACDTCRRLHKLGADKLGAETCSTANCPGTLREPSEAFPTPYGPVNGTHAVRWNGGPQSLGGIGQPQPVAEDTRALVFRYGLMIGLSRLSLSSYRWEGGQWQRRHNTPLLNMGELETHSVMVEQGKVFILGRDRAQVYSLMDDLRRVPSEFPGHFTRQVVGRRWWARVPESGPLRLTDCSGSTFTDYTVELPANAGHVLDIALADTADERLYLATASGGLLIVDPGSCTTQELPRHPVTWTRIAVQDGRIVALGVERATARRVALLTCTVNGHSVQGPRYLEAGSVADFAWAGDTVYVARNREDGRRELDLYDLQQLTRMPQSVTLQGGMQTLPGMLALVGGSDRGGPRLILRRATNNAVKFFLVSPHAGGRLEELGPFVRPSAEEPSGIPGFLDDLPQICVTESQITLVSRETNNTITFRTFGPKEQS